MTHNQLISRLKLSTMLMKIIMVNVGVFVLLHAGAMIGALTGAYRPDAVSALVEMPSDLRLLATHFWTPLTYMFAQYGVLHVLFNMLWLYWFGEIFVDINTPRRLLALYVYGGLCGAAFYLAAYNLLPAYAGHSGALIGASASVIAIVTATAILAPEIRMRLLLIGEVSLKWIAIVTIGLDLVTLSAAGAPGHIAHLGGIAAGAAFALALRRGTDLTAPFCRLADRLANLFRRSRPVSPIKPFKATKQKKTETFTKGDETTLDAILDKIKKSGYSSLTPRERATLFDVSNRIK